MTSILHLVCSPLGPASESYRLSEKIIGFLLEREPTASIIGRFIGGGALPHVDAGYAVALGAPKPTSVEKLMEGSFSLSEELIQELERADSVVIGTPMHNFTVPSALKAWIDHVVRVRRTFNLTREGKVATLRDRPIFIAISSGGRFSGARARQPDFLTPYLKAILGTIGLHDLTFFAIEGTGLGMDAVAEARARAAQALLEHFSSRLISIPPPAPEQGHLEELLDDGLAQTFPASDPVSSYLEEGRVSAVAAGSQVRSGG